MFLHIILLITCSNCYILSRSVWAGKLNTLTKPTPRPTWL